jgi:hypothetical protein
MTIVIVTRDDSSIVPGLCAGAFLRPADLHALNHSGETTRTYERRCRHTFHEVINSPGVERAINENQLRYGRR